MKSRTIVLAIVAVAVAAGSATAGSLITGAQIKNGSITGLDVRNHSLTSADFRGSTGGAQGAQGPQGPPGINSINHYDGASATLCPQGGGACQVAQISANCPDGEVATGGGYIGDGNSLYLSVAYAAPASAGSYGVVIINHDATSTVVFARVLCVPGVGSRTARVEVTRGDFDAVYRRIRAQLDR